MKTAIKTLFASALTAVVLTSSAFTTFAQEGLKNPSAQVNVTAFNMIKVQGNVKLHIRQSAKESISIETNNPTDQVSVKRAGQKLVISSEENAPADVYVAVKDLKRIDASGQTEVITSGLLNVTALQIFLEDDAFATVKVNADDLFTVIKGHSNLKLSGASIHHTSLKDKASRLSTNNFAVQKTTTSELLFAAADLDAQFEETLNSNYMAVNFTK